MTMIREGILNINKPTGMTSHDVVNKVRRATGIKRVGHTGTLDPMATGVLPICIGSAARITEYLDLDFKTYRCEMMFGKTTDTQDIWGEIIEEKDTKNLDEESIRDAFSEFSGLIEQVPPMYSAVKVGGRKLYEYAREGMQVKVKPRTVYIKELKIEKIDMAAKTAAFTVECSKGTYIRSICSRAGEKLGCGSVMIALERTASGMFKINDAVSLSEIEHMSHDDIDEILVGADFPLVHFGKAVVDRETGIKFADGFHLPLNKCRIDRKPEFEDKDFVMEINPKYRKTYNVYMEAAGSLTFLGVAYFSEKYKKLVADKVFYKR